MFGVYDEVKQEIMDIPGVGGNPRRVWSLDNLKQFGSWIRHAAKAILEEKEIILFCVMQVVAIAAAYYLWVQMLGWIPESVWESKEKLHNVALNLALLAWSFLCVGLASGPIALFTGCIGASHFLKRQGFPSTIGSCFRMVMPRAWSLWIFYWVDGWFTVNQILERLPKKNHHTNREVKAFRELLYYAWKLGTVGILPAILNGKNLFLAGKESVLLIRTKPKEVMLLRGGYSLFCWIVGILAYGGCIVLFAAFPHLIRTGNFVYSGYSWVGIPILIAVTVIQLFIRPIFILGSCELYSQNVVTEQINPVFKTSPPFAYSALVGFALLVMILGTVFLYREPLGLMGILELRHQQDDATQPRGPNLDLRSYDPAYDNEKSLLLDVASVVKKPAECANPTVRIVGDQIEEVCP